MRVDWEVKLGFKDVLIRPKRSTLKSRSDVSLLRTYRFKHSQMEWTGIPIITANMDTTGTFSMAKKFLKHQLMTAIHKHYTLEQWQRFLMEITPDIYDYVMVSTGIQRDDFDKLKQLMLSHPELKFICVDVANGYTEYFVDYLKQIREHYPDKTIIAGNIVTPEMCEALILNGVDILKVGIGPGSVCTTRVKTGVGYPQLSAIMECADAAHGLGAHIVADGGCVCSGDIVKAFAAGADFVMLGGMLSGHNECEGEKTVKDGKTYFKFYGMSSQTAMEKHSGGVAAYRASEGKTTWVPSKGAVDHTIQDILGGMRSACTYVGAASLKELSKRTTFVRVAEQENQVFTPS